MDQILIRQTRTRLQIHKLNYISNLKWVDERCDTNVMMMVVEYELWLDNGRKHREFANINYQQCATLWTRGNRDKVGKTQLKCWQT